MTDTRNSEMTYAAGNVICFVAEYGTEDPGNMSALSSPWLNLGWQDVSGLIRKLAENLKDIMAAGTLEPIRTIVTGAPKTFDITCVEGLNPVVRALYDDVPLSSLQPAPSTTIASYLLPEIPPNNPYAFVFDTFDGDAMIRNYVPQGKITGRGNDQQQQGDGTFLQMTITAYTDMIGGTRAAQKTYINYGDRDLTPYFS